MFINNVNLTEFFKISDCLCYDGLYENVLDEILAKYNNIGLCISENNFCFPIKKDKKINLTEEELNFNKQLGSYRILYNIKNFVKKNNVEEKPYHKLWLEQDFDFFDSIKDFNIEPKSNKTIYKKENITKMKNLQDDLLNKILSDNNLKNSMNKNKMQIDIDIDDNSANDKDLYEIQYIIKHRKINNNEIEYEVKWRNYKKQYNSWVKESDFQSDDIIKKYWKTINSKSNITNI
ncbi:hypothetical protein BDB01DRAFT_732678 [Pilobolus umbonatus]|nr:hypothetical protein BDB01DRAFT_732678 [Pilobolus umbonatus]